MQSISQTSQPTDFSSPATVQANLNTAMGCVVLLLPILLWLSVTAHRKHRAALLRQQIQMLEKLWLLSSTETRH